MHACVPSLPRLLYLLSMAPLLTCFHYFATPTSPGLATCGNCPSLATCTLVSSTRKAPYCVCPRGYGMASTGCVAGASSPAAAPLNGRCKQPSSSSPQWQVQAAQQQLPSTAGASSPAAAPLNGRCKQPSSSSPQRQLQAAQQQLPSTAGASSPAAAPLNGRCKQPSSSSPQRQVQAAQQQLPLMAGASSPAAAPLRAKTGVVGPSGIPKVVSEARSQASAAPLTPKAGVGASGISRPAIGLPIRRGAAGVTGSGIPKPGKAGVVGEMGGEVEECGEL
ncbi:unnamed protein product [Closterium sp. Naga37s-1]|nr:unnamed protein product [Closterium sp. Naga37s-1]